MLSEEIGTTPYVTTGMLGMFIWKHMNMHDRHVHWKRDKQANKQTIHWANNLKKQLFFISVKDCAFLHGKVVITQFNANQWFYGPVNAKWLALT